MAIEAPARVEAELFLRAMGSGRNKPVLVRGRLPDGGAVDCVAKLFGALALEQRALSPIPYLCEWLGAVLAPELGVRAPTPYELVVTREYADALDEPERTTAQESIGSSFASQHVSAGLSQYTLEMPDAALRGPAATLLAFDVFIHNVDRRAGTNANLFVSRDDVVAYDHGDAFAFLLPLIGDPDPVTDALEKVVEEHACRPWLRRREFSFDAFRAALGSLSDDVFGEIEAAAPSAWQVGAAAGKLATIVDVLKRRRDAVEEWLPRVQRCLER